MNVVEKKKDPREGHRHRLRLKFLEYGLEKLTEAEVLELLLSFGTPRRDCKITAREMLDRFGTIRDVFEAPFEELAKVIGAGPNNIIAVKFIHAVSGKYLEQRLTGRTFINSSVQVLEYLCHDLENQDKEIFKVIHLDNDNVIIKIEDLSKGSVNRAYVYPREILERAITLKSTGLVFVHNHPSGNVRPSEEDVKLTRRLVHLAFLADVMVLDHLIIGKGGQSYSFKNEGVLAIFEQEIRLSYNMPPRPSGALLHEANSMGLAPVKLKSKRSVKVGKGGGLGLGHQAMTAENDPPYEG